MKGKGKSMKSGGNKSTNKKAYNEHSAEKRRQQDPASVVTQAYNRATKGGE
jgi:hypothetical protein